MSGLAVRSYVKWAVDPNSFQKAQAQYNGHLASLQKQGVDSTKKSNEAIMAQHKTFVDKMNGVQADANKRLNARTKQIAQEVAASAKLAQAAAHGYKGQLTKTGGLDKRFAMDSAAYEKSLKRMEAANKGFVARTKSQGYELAQGQQFDTAGFASLDTQARADIIDNQRLHTQELGKTNKGYQANLSLLRQAETVHRRLSRAERERDIVIAKSNKLKAVSLKIQNRLLAVNTAAMREQIQLQMRMNQAFDSAIAHVGGGLVNAFMASGIAIMSFHFKLQSLIDTFQQFEKELMNAQSIFQTTNEVLYSLSDEIVNFGTQYGISLGTAAEGLYTLASAGLSANDSQEVLANTLKLSMAVQGDHDTIAKLTTQTIFGFGLQMSESAELTDKFAHAINMSLIEYQDLASAVKFAMPFFVSTGQNVDQLLGSLQVLTNRALEAGIAGRGLRQALAEFAQHAQDSTAAFAKMGVEIMNTDGSFKLLTEIAREFSDAMGPAASDVDLMTTLLEDLNVRGATAFVHLVQNVDEFEGAVNDLSNSAGSATRMADIQQQSLANQIQVVKNALVAPFLLSDKVAVANGEMNTFSVILKELTTDFEAFFLETLPDGNRVLTENGVVMRDMVIQGLREMVTLVQNVMAAFDSNKVSAESLTGTLHALFIPINLLSRVFGLFGADLLKGIMMFKMLNAIIPVTQINTMALTAATETLAMAETAQTLAAEQALAMDAATINAKGAKVVVMDLENIATQESIATKGVEVTQIIRNTEQTKINSASKFKNVLRTKQQDLASQSHIVTAEGEQFAIFGVTTQTELESDSKLRNAIVSEQQKNADLKVLHTKEGQVLVVQANAAGTDMDTKSKLRNAAAAFTQAAAQMGANAAMMLGFTAIQKASPLMKAFGQIMFMVAGALMAFSIAQQFALKGVHLYAALAAGAAMMSVFANVMSMAMKPPKMPETPDSFDMGGMIYDTGKRVNRDMPDGISGLGSRHFPIMVEPGETIIPKTQNMLPTAGSGITLNIQGDIVTNDAEDFAHRIAEVLPQALRAQNDMGGI